MKKLFLSLILSLILVPQIKAESSPDAKLNVAFLVYDDMNILDYSGPREVFSQAARTMKSKGIKQEINAYTIGYPSLTIKAIEGTVIQADYTLDNSPQPDFLILPGGNITHISKDLKVIEWIKNIANTSKVTMSVCTGAALLAETGLLDGKEATTHHLFLASFKERYPRVKLRNDMRFVDEGSVMTTAGVSAGIDGALHLIIRYFGKDIALSAVSAMEYDWNPKLQK